jgi:hypothetical protein
MAPESRKCQNCKIDFHIDVDDFAFYRRIGVPSPTWCPECRMIRRFLFRNERHLFRRKDSRTGEEIFSSYPAAVSATVYGLEFWNSDGWEPMEYGREYDFSRPFFEQFRELLYTVPWPAKSVVQMVNSDYCDQAGYLKNCYLCFNCGDVENGAYLISSFTVKDSFDIYQARHTELSYENYMSDECYRVFFSFNCEECVDVWFSKDLVGCNNCFGCTNLRNKSYYIFNKPYSKEAYHEKLKEFDLGSYKVVQELRTRASAFWLQFPVRFTLAIRTVNSTGEHIEASKNLKLCYSVHGGEDLAYSQFLEPPATDSYDFTNFGWNTTRMYESVTIGEECSDFKSCWECWPSSRGLEYSVFCRSSSDLFSCVGLKKKQYCIFNKQYSKDDYLSLRERIIEHMHEMPFKDTAGRIYKYGEFFPPEFSPFAYNETLAGDFFPLKKEEAEAKGFRWRDPEVREFKTTKDAADLPDNIKDTDNGMLKEVIACVSCGHAYRIIQMEFEFYKKIGLPLPRLCHNCRFQERFKLVNPPKWCQCAGPSDDRSIYKNTASHPSHKPEDHCPNEFETSYASGRPEIVYCEECYKSEVY